jgi:Protein of unknown function (DUF2442)
MQEIARVLTAQAESGFTLLLGFSDGSTRRFNMQPLLGRGVFAQLSDESIFAKVQVANGTICWPNELDLCPNTLYEQSVLISTTELAAA